MYTFFLSMTGWRFKWVCFTLFTWYQLEKERIAIETEKERMAEDEAKLMKRQKEAENRYNEEMAELQQLRDLQVICIFVGISY